MNNPTPWNERLKILLPEIIKIRRHLHAHPELSGQEHQTALLIAGELRKDGWKVRENVGFTGIVAELGPEDSPIVCLRVDMDALPVEELTGLSFSSNNQGVMHACGHDLHTAIGIGVAKLLAYEEKLLTRVRIIFQPAEELAKGASWMKRDGAIEEVEAIFGVHVFPSLPVGSIGIKSGSFTAAAGELKIEICGEGGHGARPHQTVDSIWIASKVITGLQEAITRQLDALKPVVISFGKIQGGKAFNIIAEKVTLLGTVRYLDETLNEELPTWIKQKVKSITESLGAKSTVSYRCIAPPINNDPELTNLLEYCAIEQLGQENVIRLEKPSLGAEDFADFLRDIKGTMFRLGVAGNDGCAPLHNGNFDPDENCLETGIQVLTSTILSWMNKKTSSNFKRS